MSSIITDISGNSFILGDYIDKGSFSKVYSLICCSTEKRFAGKFVNKEKLRHCGIMHKLWDEIKIHQKLRHRNIVQWFSYIEQDNYIVIVLEYCSRFSMVNILHSLKTLTTNQAKYFMIQVIAAVQYLHINRIVHRDLKLGNLFVNKQLEIKLGDFGLAVVLEYDGQKRFSRCGTPNYIAPEVIKGVGHSYEVDVWALGCILYTMLEGTPPFQGENTTNTYNNILKGKYCYHTEIHSSAKTFIDSTLQIEAGLRPTVHDLLVFEFIISNDIIAKPPDFDFENDGTLTVFRKRSIVNKIHTNRNIFVAKEVNHNKCPNNCFVKLFRCLSNIESWPQSNVWEFFAEAISIKPLVWVNSWIDFSNSYGYAYQLSSNSIGIIFNDQTRMLFEKEENTFQYVHTDSSVSFHHMNNIPNNRTLKKKVDILLRCGAYMKESLVPAHEAKPSGMSTKQKALLVEVFEWTRGDDVIVMFLTNGSVQVNFSRDHCKMILCGYTNTVTIIESPEHMRTLKITTLHNCGCSESLKRKLKIVYHYINRFLLKQGVVT